MGLIYRTSSLANVGASSIKNDELTYEEGDGNIAFLLTNLSGSSVSIQGNTTVSGPIQLNGTLQADGIVYMPNLTSASQNSLVTYNSSTGRLYYTASSQVNKQTLQQVTDNGNTTSRDVTFQGSGNVLTTQEIYIAGGRSTGPLAQVYVNNSFIGGHRMLIDRTEFDVDPFGAPYTLSIVRPFLNSSYALTYPTTGGFFAVSVNSTASNAAGNIIITNVPTASFAHSAPIPTLQQVTDAGNGITGSVSLYGEIVGLGIPVSNITIDPFNSIIKNESFVLSGYSSSISPFGYTISDSQRSTNIYLQASSTAGINSVRLPEANGTLTLSVNGNAADANGNVLITGGSDKSIQYNSGSSLAGDILFVYNYISSSVAINSIATGQYSFAHGNTNIAEGISSQAHGRNTYALGSRSHAEGDNTEAFGINSHAEGFNTTASGSHSHAEGVNTRALKNGSHSAGFWTVADGLYQSVIGQYNISSSVQSAFILGNGSSDSTKSNLIFAAGNAVEITGSLNVSGSTTINDILVLTPRTTTPVNPASGSIIVSGSGATIRPYFWDGNAWTQMFT
jgi:hypothetical protein